LGDFSAAINSLEDVKTRISKVLNLSYQNWSHSDVDTSSLVWKIQKVVTEEQWNQHIPHREGNDKAKARVVTIRVGTDKLKRSTLATFNKKVYAAVQSKSYRTGVDAADPEDDIDALPPVGLQVNDD
jgi:hypothetical protein